MDDHRVWVAKVVGDVLAGVAVVGSIFKMLPAIAAGFAVVWYLIQIYEKATDERFSDTRIGKWIKHWLH